MRLVRRQVGINKENMFELKDEMTKVEIADALRVNRSSVQRWIDTYQLVGGEKKNINGVSKWVFPKHEVEKYLKEQNEGKSSKAD